MALTEIQLPDKQDFYRDVQSVAGEIKSRGLRWQEMSEFIQDLQAADMDAMGIPAGQIRTDLQNFRTSLDALVVEVNTHEDVWDALRRMMVV